MVDEDLRELLARGEGQRLEFKAAEADAAAIARAIAAMANSGGGTVLLGVADNGDLLGREALANALAHRDWSLEGAKVRLFMFDITFRSIAPREGVAPTRDPFRVLLERGEISERPYTGLVYARDHGLIARREYVEVTGAPLRTGTRDLANLVAKGLIESVGGRGWRTAYRPRGVDARSSGHDQAMIVPRMA